MAKHRLVAAVELTTDGIRRIVLVGKNDTEVSEGHRLLARVTPALTELDKRIRVLEVGLEKKEV